MFPNILLKGAFILFCFSGAALFYWNVNHELHGKNLHKIMGVFPGATFSDAPNFAQQIVKDRKAESYRHDIFGCRMILTEPDPSELFKIPLMVNTAALIVYNQ